MRALLIQPGARHSYALARFLHQAGALQRLYTDFAIASGSFEHRIQRAIASAGVGRNMSRRVVAGVPEDLVRRHRLSRTIARDRSDHWDFLDRDLKQADIVYSQYFAGG